MNSGSSMGRKRHLCSQFRQQVLTKVLDIQGCTKIHKYIWIRKESGILGVSFKGTKDTIYFSSANLSTIAHIGPGSLRQFSEVYIFFQPHSKFIFHSIFSDSKSVFPHICLSLLLRYPKSLQSTSFVKQQIRKQNCPLLCRSMLACRKRFMQACTHKTIARQVPLDPLGPLEFSQKIRNMFHL